MMRLFHMELIPLYLAMTIANLSVAQGATTTQPPSENFNSPQIRQTADSSSTKSNQEIADISKLSSSNTKVVQRPLNDTRQMTSVSHGDVVQRQQNTRIFSVTVDQPQSEEKKRADGQILAKGWQKLKDLRYREAAQIFSFALSVPELRNEAAYGLASCKIAQGEKSESIRYLQSLVDEKYRPEDTQPLLLSLLIEQKRYQEALLLTTSLPAEDSISNNQTTLNENKFLQSYLQALSNENDRAVELFLATYADRLTDCKDQEKFREIADNLKGKSPNRSTDIYKKLISCSKDEKLRIGILYELSSLLPPRDLIALCEAEKNNPHPGKDYHHQIDTLEIGLYETLLGIEGEKTEDIAREILDRYPQNNRALTTLGWHYLGNKEFNEAYHSFSAISETDSNDTDRVTGLIHSLAGMKRFEDALKLIENNRQDPKIGALKKAITLHSLWNKIETEGGDLTEFESDSGKILELDPENLDIVRLRAWRYYNAGEFQKSFVDFNRLYIANAIGQDHAYGLAATLVKLRRYDDAAVVLENNVAIDKRLASLESSIWTEKAKIAFKSNNFTESEIYSKKALDADRHNEAAEQILEASRYNQTSIAKILSPLTGLPGYVWGSGFQDLTGATGTGGYLLVNQGIDWVQLPGDILLNTYGELRYNTRTKDTRYFDEKGHSLGILLKKSALKLGAAYSTENYPRQNRTITGGKAFFEWYYDWKNPLERPWINARNITGTTYGRITHDFEHLTGETISSYAKLGVDWGNFSQKIACNSYMEYRINFRSEENTYYNSHGPVVGLELRKDTLEFGVDYYLERMTEQHVTTHKSTIYLRWYYDWDLKRKDDRPNLYDEH